MASELRILLTPKNEEPSDFDVLKGTNLVIFAPTEHWISDFINQLFFDKQWMI